MAHLDKRPQLRYNEIMNDSSIIEKIQKLLALASSENQNEAQLALRRANELLIRYNLTMSDVAQKEYVTGNYPAGSRRAPHHHEVLNLISRFFFVRAAFSATRRFNSETLKIDRDFEIHFFGTELNVKIAGQVFSYLDRVYPELWKMYRKAKGKKVLKQRGAFFSGLSHGISTQLENMRFGIQEETGLVVTGNDPGLDLYVDGLGGRSISLKKQRVTEVWKAGHYLGEKVQIQKGVEHAPKESGRQLGHSKK